MKRKADASIRKKLKHLRRRFKFTEAELDDACRFYENDPSSLESAGVKHLFLVSADICEKWNRLFSNFDVKRKWWKSRRLLKLLFPKLPFGVVIRRGLNLVIGRVELSSKVFINVNARFGPLAEVKIGKKTQIGPNLTVDLASFGKVIIQDNVWICSGVTIFSTTNIQKGSIVGSGAYVSGRVRAHTLAVGRPAKTKKYIKENEMFSLKKWKTPFVGEELEIMKTKMHLRYPFLSQEMFSNVLESRPFSAANLSLARLYLKTHYLCQKLDDVSLSEGERKEIIDELFPIHGKGIAIGKNFFLDLIGTVVLGNDVTIGDNVSFGGVIRIGNGVQIGNNTCLFSSNHPLDYRQRYFGFHRGMGLSVPLVYPPISAMNKVKIGEGCCAAPGCLISSSLPNDSLVLTDGKVIFAPILAGKRI